MPFGETMVEHNQSKYGNSKYDNAYKFNGKELDESTQMYYYGARYYDPRISIFVSKDQMAEKTMTPYQYVHNNPITFTDPTGMTAKDWKINKEGRFEAINNESTPDRVFNEKGEFVQLEYNGQIQEYQDKRKDGQLNILKFKDEEMSTKAFEFFAENSNVEWGQVKAEHRSYVMTDEDPIAVSASSYARLLLESNMKVKEINHSHPVGLIGEESPSGYGHNPTANNMYSEPNPYRVEGDYHSMRLLIDGGEVNGVKLKGFGDKARAINFRVFNPVSKTYIKYDESKAVKQQ